MVWNETSPSLSSIRLSRNINLADFVDFDGLLLLFFRTISDSHLKKGRLCRDEVVSGEAPAADEHWGADPFHLLWLVTWGRRREQAERF